MYNLSKTRFLQGKQYIEEPQKAEVNKMFRGFPVISSAKCKGCGDCSSVCPTGALNAPPLSIDMGKCLFCGGCAGSCPNNAVVFTNKHMLAADSRGKLIINENITYEEFRKNAFEIRKEIKKLFGRSLKLRSVSAGGCNACEMELNACSNVNFDMGRYGIEIAASPKHSDGIIITGPITANMYEALNDAYSCTPEPKIVIAMGTCAISGGVFYDSGALNREFMEKVKVDIYIPGCPVHPLTFINGILDFLGR